MSNISANSLLIEPYSKGSLMMKEACQKQASHILCNRVVHFIVGASLLIPIVNTIVTLIMRCFCKAKEGSTTTAAKSLENRASVSSQETKKNPFTNTKTTSIVTETEASSEKQSSSDKTKKIEIVDSSQSRSSTATLEKKPKIEKKDEAKRSLDCELTLGIFRKCPDVLIDKINRFLPFNDQVSFSFTNKAIHKIAIKPIVFSHAVDLVFHEGGLENHDDIFKDLEDREIRKYTEEEHRIRHERLLEKIKDIDRKDINFVFNYREGMGWRSTTLLVLAMGEIENPNHRKEVVERLLAKGADPRICGYNFGNVDPLKVAEEKDPSLLPLLKEAIKKLEKIEAEQTKE